MYANYVKRLLDLVISLAIMPLWLLVFAIVASAIYLQDRGPVFFNAPRLGKDGRVFTMYKFRSMKVGAPDIRNIDGSTFNAMSDGRLTSIGRILRKTSIDETPQILNVIRGNMSIIGPRPDLPDHVNLYEGNELRKLEVRPGITGFSQAYYRNAVPWKERIQHDIFYIDNMNMQLDFKILCKTFLTVFCGEKVFSPPKMVDSGGDSTGAGL